MANETVDLRSTAEVRLAIKATTGAGSVSGILERRGHLMADALLVLMPGVGIPGRFNLIHTRRIRMAASRSLV